MIKQTATPRPWKVVRDGQGNPYIEGNAAYDPVTEARGVKVAQVTSTLSDNPLWRQIQEMDANADLIVTAVNAFDDLVKACEDALELAESYSDVEDGDYGSPRPNKAMRVATTLRTALDKAKG